MLFFLSYAQEETHIAEKIKEFLEHRDIDVFFAPTNIDIGAKWEQEICDSINQCDAFLILWSNNASKSNWVNFEIARALIYEKRIYPIRIDSVQTHHNLRAFQFLNWNSSNEEISLNKLAQEIGIPVQKGQDDLAYESSFTVENAKNAYRKSIVSSFSHLTVLGEGKKYEFEDAYLPLYMKNRFGSDAAVAASAQISLGLGRIVVLGNPGAGKTTLIRHVAHKCASFDQMLPVFSPISRIVKTSKPLVEHIHSLVQQATNKSIAEILTKHEEFGQETTIVLLDGLDEITDDQRSCFFERLADFVVTYPNCNIVITSRVSNFKSLELDELDFSLFDLQSLSTDNIERYISKRANDFDVSELSDIFGSNDRLFELAKVPFMLAMICASPLDVRQVTNRASLFKKCTKYLLKKRPRNQIEPRLGESSLVDLERLLENVAVRFLKLDSTDSIRHDELEFAIRQTGKDYSAPSIISFLVDNSGILQRTGDGYSFVHRSIAEYYVALGMKREPLENLVDRASMPTWEEPIKLFVGLLPNDKLDEVISSIWFKNRALALRALTELRSFPISLLDKLIGGLDRSDRVRLCHEVIDTAKNSTSRTARKRILLDTLTALLQVETDCEVIYNCVMALKELDDADCEKLAKSTLDLEGADARRHRYLNDSHYKFEFVYVEGGEFLMGWNESPDTREKPAHRVRLSPFSIARYPVVNCLYYDSFPFAINRRGLGGYSEKDHQPVNNVTWYEAVVFAWWLGCDLPSEAEWEYACRAGGKDDSAFMDTSQIPDYAWYAENSDNRTHSVGGRKPNSLKLYDMIGNVREWVKDWYSEDEYYRECFSKGLVIDPVAPEMSDRKVLRGGVFDWATTNLRPTYRPMNPPENVFFGNGFRLVYRQKV